jgi:hypothetical protein
MWDKKFIDYDLAIINELLVFTTTAPQSKLYNKFVGGDTTGDEVSNVMTKKA